MGVTQFLGRIDDESLRAELETCKRFLLDSEIEEGKHRVLYFAMEILDAHTLSQKLDRVLEKLNCAEKLEVAFGFVHKNVELGTCR